MPWIFDVDKCPVPPLEKLPANDALIQDCEIPSPPPAIFQCPDHGENVPLDPAIIGPPGPPGADGSNATINIAWQCVDADSYTEIDDEVQPLKIIFDKGASFKVEKNIERPDELLVGLTGCTSNAIFWLADANGKPVFTRSPVIGRGAWIADAADGWLKLGRFFKANLMNPRGAGPEYTIRLPENLPPGINSYLMVWNLAGQGTCIQTRWSPQGVTGDCYVFDTDGVTKIKMRVERGLVVQLGSAYPVPGDKTDAPLFCDVGPGDPCDPCQ